MTSREPKPVGFAVAVVAPFPPPSGGMSVQAAKLAERLTGEGIPVETVAVNPVLPRWSRWAESVPGLRTALREAVFLRRMLAVLPKVSVVHHLSASGLYFFLTTTPVTLLGRLWGRRVIVNYRGGLAESFLKRWGWLAVPILRMAHHVAVSSAFLQRVFGRHGVEASLLPNLADLERFHYRERMPLRPRLIVTRNLEPMYNVECVLRAFRAIQQRYPEATLCVAGSGSEQARLQKLAGELNLSGLTFLGAVRHEDLPQLYDDHHILVNASNVDNFPGSLLEAACCGLPVVTTAAGGIPDMIQDHQTGLLVGVNDHEALAGAVLELLAQPELALRLARAARRWVEQFCWERVYGSLLEHYGLPSVAAANQERKRAWA